MCERIECVWEHNGDDTLLYAVNLPGAYARGENKDIAISKMQNEALSWLQWSCGDISDRMEIKIVQDAPCMLDVKDADSDVLFDTERDSLSLEEYTALKMLVLKSAADFQLLYESIPDKNKSDISQRRTFYGQMPRTAEEMYNHTKNVNAYYFGEINIDADNDGTILECRRRGFDRLELMPDFLDNPVIEGSYGEWWSLRKMMRRFLWHDRIHAKAMYRMAVRLFGAECIPDVFCFGEIGCTVR